jgi:hypothetical protein
VSNSVYFLDAQQAELQALVLIDQALANNQTLVDIPLCYYHADQKVVNQDALNCVWLPLEKVYDFFQYSNLPLPTEINFSGALQFLEQDLEFIAEFNGMLAQLVKHREQLLSLYRFSPLDRDGLFFDAQIALLTAIRRTKLVRYQKEVIQRCYYLGQKLPISLENLVHIDLDHYVSFFASSIYETPCIVIPSINMNSTEMLDAEKALTVLNQLVLKHKCTG